MYFGKLKDNDSYGFSTNNNIFETYKEVTEELHEELFEEAKQKKKIFSADENGDPILVDLPEPSEQEKIEMRIRHLEHYLESTDWYAIRFADEGTPVPEEIKKNRSDARVEISELREQLNQFNI